MNGSSSSRNRKERTLIRVRRAQAEPKAVWAGTILQASFAPPRNWMATSNCGRTPSCPLDRWDFEAIAETRGRCEGCVPRPRGALNRMGGCCVVQTQPSGRCRGMAMSVLRFFTIGNNALLWQLGDGNVTSAASQWGILRPSTTYKHPPLERTTLHFRVSCPTRLEI